MMNQTTATPATFEAMYNCGCYFSCNLIAADTLEDATKYAEAYAARYNYEGVKVVTLDQWSAEEYMRKGMPFTGVATVREFCEGLTDIDGNEIPQTETENKEEAETMNANQTETRTAADMIRDELNISTRSAWLRGVAQYAAELLDELDEAERHGYFDHEDFAAPRILRKALLNGASDWNQYSEGGCSLIYDAAIAARLCTKSELKQTHNGQREPNARESWLNVQARALHQAAECIVLTAAVIAARMEA